MSTGQLDRATALVVVDVQGATVGIPSALEMGAVVANAARLASGFRDLGLAVALVWTDLNDPPPGRTTYSGVDRPLVSGAALAIVPELASGRQDIVLRKRGWSAFSAPGLNEQLRDRGVETVVLAGLATAFGIESTARQAYDLGYNVIVASDAINNPQSDSHENSLTRVFPALAVIHTTEQLVEMLPTKR